MRPGWMGLCRAVALLMLCAGPGLVHAGERGPTRPARAFGDDSVTARVIVKYRADSALRKTQAANGAGRRAPLHAQTMAARLNLNLNDGRVLGAHTQSLSARGLRSAELAQRLQAQPEVEWVVEDQRRTISAVPNDPYFGPDQKTITPSVGQWYLRAPDASLVSAINAQGAWNLTTGSADVTVAVLDTGVRYDHPDLQGKLHPGYDFVYDARYSNDGNGRDADANDPGDADPTGYCDKYSSWHGTQVAGLIGAATNNGIGIAGTGYNIMVLPVRVLGVCGGYDSDIIAGMRWAAGISQEVGVGTSKTVVNTHPARVLNMSLGSTGACSAAYRDAIAELTSAGVTVVASAGNESGTPVGVPANCPGALAVSGLRHLGSKVGYSNIGPEVAISAPAGNCVNTGSAEPCLYPLLTTTNLGAITAASNGYSDSYQTASIGTSFSAPLVSGAIGLMLSIDKSLQPDAIKTVLQKTARPFPTSGAAADVIACQAPSSKEQLECYCTTQTCGAGMLDVAAAVSAVAGPPTVVITPDGAIDRSSMKIGQTAAFNASLSTLTGNRSVAAYEWSLLSGQSLASFSGSTSGSTATLTTQAAGNVVVQLRITDSAGYTNTATYAIAIEAPTVTVTATSTVAPTSGGGGSLSWAWLLGLFAATLCLGAERQARQRRHRGPG